MRQKYPAATVDTSGGKAISLSGGSLQRPVDVVPSHWYNTKIYQSSWQDHDRAVTILDLKADATIDNLPFLHIKHVHERDLQVQGGLKKAIRLAKNVKADAENEGTVIQLPSFDIAAALYHADQQALAQGYLYELAILAETQRFLDQLATNTSFALSLRTPDGLRPIFNTPDKLVGLTRLSVEVDDLAREVAKEQNTILNWQTTPSLKDSREAIAKVLVK